jgi:hypothetical protein
LTFHSRGRFPNNELKACEDSSCGSLVKGVAATT